MGVKMKIENLDFYYEDFKALKNINMDIEEKKVTALIGPSGCGKSTLIKTMNRMTDLIEGTKITGDISLDNNPYGDYEIKAEQYSGAIRRRTISAFVGNLTARYGDGLAEEPTAAAEYSAAEGGSGTQLQISALVAIREEMAAKTVRLFDQREKPAELLAHHIIF